MNIIVEEYVDIYHKLNQVEDHIEDKCDDYVEQELNDVFEVIVQVLNCLFSLIKII